MKYKVIEILKTFSEKETKQFDSFLLSPFFNESRKLRNFYTALLEFYPDFNSEFMCEEKLSSMISPDIPYNKSTMKTLFYDLANCADEFLRISNFRNGTLEADDYLREEYFKRKLYKFADQNIEKSLKQLNSEKDYDYEYFLNRFHTLNDKCNLHRLIKTNSNLDFMTDFMGVLNERAKFLLYMSANELLIQDNLIHTLKKNYNIKDENNFIFKLFKKINIEGLMEFIISESDDVTCSLIFELQLANYKVLSDFENEDLYFEYKNLLIKNIHLLNNSVIYTNMIRLIKYCMSRLSDNNSKIDFKTELFSIYKYILAKKYYVLGVHDYLPIELYRPVLKLGLELKKYKWTLDFIKRYIPLLNSDIRSNMYNYSLAEYFFHKKRFDDALRYFHKIELNHFLLRVDLRNLMLKTFYELNLFENAISLIDSYKHFISKTEVLSEAEKNKCRYFILSVQNLIKCKTSIKSTAKHQIHEYLKHDMYSKDWVIERFNSIDNRIIKSA